MRGPGSKLERAFPLLFFCLAAVYTYKYVRRTCVGRTSDDLSPRLCSRASVRLGSYNHKNRFVAERSEGCLRRLHTQDGVDEVWGGAMHHPSIACSYSTSPPLPIPPSHTTPPAASSPSPIRINTTPHEPVAHTRKSPHSRQLVDQRLRHLRLKHLPP